MPDYEANGEDIDNYGSSPLPKSRSSHGGSNPDDYTDSKPQVLKFSLSLALFDHPFSHTQHVYFRLLSWRLQDPLKQSN